MPFARALMVLAVLAAAACGAANAPVKAATGDMTLGAANAPVTVIEYASPTCPVCKAFHDEEFPVLKSKYIDTGKVRFIYREMPSHNPPVDVAIFLLARCAGADKYFAVIDDAYARRDEIERASVAGKAKDALVGMGQKVGLSAAQTQTCITDSAGMTRITAGAEQALKDYKVNGTPTVIVDNETLDGFGIDQVTAKIEERLKAAGK